MTIEWVDHNGKDAVKLVSLVNREGYTPFGLDPEFFTGEHDGADNASVLVDSLQDWPPDFFIGNNEPWFLINKENGSKGQITDSDGTTITASLSGGDGSENDFDAGDNYLIGGVRPDTHDGLLNTTVLSNILNANSTVGVDVLTIDGEQFMYDDGHPEAFEHTFSFDADFGTMTSAQKTAVEDIIKAHDGVESTDKPISKKREAEQSTTENTFQEAYLLTTPPLAQGTWQFDLSCAIKTTTSTFNSACEVETRARKNSGTWTGNLGAFCSNIALYDSDSVRIPFQAEEGDIWEIRVRFKRTGTSQEVFIKQIRASLTFSGEAWEEE